MSSIQKIERHDGHGHVDWSHVSGLVWSCRLANHLPKHSRHHIGRQKHVRHWPTSGASQFFTNLTLALVCKQPIHVSNSSNKQNVNNRMDIYYKLLVDLMVIDILDFVQFVVENLPKINHQEIDVQQYFSHFQYLLEVCLVNHHIHWLSI